jgi:hypothetical protein
MTDHEKENYAEDVRKKEQSINETFTNDEKNPTNVNIKFEWLKVCIAKVDSLMLCTFDFQRRLN